jgi:hypothetical protein
LIPQSLFVLHIISTIALSVRIPVITTPAFKKSWNIIGILDIQIMIVVSMRLRNLLKNGQKNVDLIRIPTQVRILSRTQNVGTGDLFSILSLLWMMYLQ